MATDEAWVMMNLRSDVDVDMELSSSRTCAHNCNSNVWQTIFDFCYYRLSSIDESSYGVCTVSTSHRDNWNHEWTVPISSANSNCANYYAYTDCTHCTYIQSLVTMMTMSVSRPIYIYIYVCVCFTALLAFEERWASWLRPEFLCFCCCTYLLFTTQQDKTKEHSAATLFVIS
jgi:hypothetical protein